MGGQRIGVTTVGLSHLTRMLTPPIVSHMLGTSYAAGVEANMRDEVSVWTECPSWRDEQGCLFETTDLDKDLTHVDDIPVVFKHAGFAIYVETKDVEVFIKEKEVGRHADPEGSYGWPVCPEHHISYQKYLVWKGLIDSS